MLAVLTSLALVVLAAAWPPNAQNTPLTAADAWGRVACWDVNVRFMPGPRTCSRGFVTEVVTGQAAAANVTVDLAAGQFVMGPGSALDVSPWVAAAWSGLGDRAVYVQYQLGSADQGGRVLAVTDKAYGLQVELRADMQPSGDVAVSAAFTNGVVGKAVSLPVGDTSGYAAAVFSWQTGTVTLYSRASSASNWTSARASAARLFDPVLAAAVVGDAFSGRISDIQFYTNYWPTGSPPVPWSSLAAGTTAGCFQVMAENPPDGKLKGRSDGKLIELGSAQTRSWRTASNGFAGLFKFRRSRSGRSRVRSPAL